MTLARRGPRLARCARTNCKLLAPAVVFPLEVDQPTWCTGCRLLLAARRHWALQIPRCMQANRAHQRERCAHPSGVLAACRKWTSHQDLSCAGCARRAQTPGAALQRSPPHWARIRCSSQVARCNGACARRAPTPVATIQQLQPPRARRRYIGACGRKAQTHVRRHRSRPPRRMRLASLRAGAFGRRPLTLSARLRRHRHPHARSARLRHRRHHRARRAMFVTRARSLGAAGAPVPTPPASTFPRSTIGRRRFVLLCRPWWRQQSTR
mmetsp:Transcript_35577/g.75736  ORF Transcript_35577/g.75736 Transcript_35577/m.75736 type:complete len:267 (-) Transcript_35577:199-999(-)